MVHLFLFAALALGQAPARDIDIWFYPNIEITGHSEFDHTPGRSYDARDAFGGAFSTVPNEQGHVVFEDDTGGPGQPDFIEWNTKALVEINRLVFSWQDDYPGNNWRNLSHFWIMARRTPADKWQVLWQEGTPSQVGRYTMEKRIAPAPWQYFRAEFVRTSASNITAVAPRICAIEAYGHVVSE